MPADHPFPNLRLTSAQAYGDEAYAALGQLVAEGRGDSAEATALRVVLLRAEDHALRVETDVVPGTGPGIVMKVTLQRENGAVASAIAQGSDLAETTQRALRQALDLLGHTLIVGEIAAGEGNPAQTFPAPLEDAVIASTPFPDDDEREDDPPVDAEPLEPLPRPSAPRTQPPAVVEAVRRANLRRRPSADDPVRAEPSASEVTETPARTPSTPPSAREPQLADYSWTAFWRVARSLGLNKESVEQQIGRPIEGMTPLQVREALAEVGIELEG